MLNPTLGPATGRASPLPESQSNPIGAATQSSKATAGTKQTKRAAARRLHHGAPRGRSRTGNERLPMARHHRALAQQLGRPGAAGGSGACGGRKEAATSSRRTPRRLSQCPRERGSTKNYATAATGSRSVHHKERNREAKGPWRSFPRRGRGSDGVGCSLLHPRNARCWGCWAPSIPPRSVPLPFQAQSSCERPGLAQPPATRCHHHRSVTPAAGGPGTEPGAPHSSPGCTKPRRGQQRRRRRQPGSRQRPPSNAHTRRATRTGSVAREALGGPRAAWPEPRAAALSRAGSARPSSPRLLLPQAAGPSAVAGSGTRHALPRAGTPARRLRAKRPALVLQAA